jgi:DNA-directed RNA polymerase specialized sigma subunit
MLESAKEIISSNFDKNDKTDKTISVVSDLYSVSRRTIGLILIEKRYKTIATDLDLSLRKKQYVKLEECDYNEIKKLNEEGMKQTEIAQMYGVNQSHISKIINNENYIKTMNINKDGRVSH